MDLVTLALAKKYTDKQIENSEHQGPGTTTWGDIANKPEAFPPEAHTHTIEQVVDLKTTLDEKAPSSHVTQKINEGETHGMRVNLDGKFEFFNGTNWVEVSGGGSGDGYVKISEVPTTSFQTEVAFAPGGLYEKCKLVIKNVSHNSASLLSIALAINGVIQAGTYSGSRTLNNALTTIPNYAAQSTGHASQKNISGYFEVVFNGGIVTVEGATGIKTKGQYDSFENIEFHRGGAKRQETGINTLTVLYVATGYMNEGKVELWGVPK